MQSWDDQIIIKNNFDDHYGAAKMGGESGRTGHAILFVKTKTLKIRNKFAHICGEE
jgi:hypothetical protein